MKKIKICPLIVLIVGCLIMSSAQAVKLTAEQKLGKKLYSDTDLSLNNNQSCATCHSLEVVKLADDSSTQSPGFVDAFNVASGSSVSAGSVAGFFGGLNAPSAGYAAFSPDFFLDETEGLWIGGQFWNGRALNLEEQAKGPFLNPAEMAMPSRWAVISVIKERKKYVKLFNKVYGFDLDAVPSYPLAPSDDGAPSSVYEAYDLMADAIAAFERSSIFNRFDSKFDAVMAGKATFTDKEAMGFDMFVREDKGNCAACHVVDKVLMPGGDGVTLFPPMFTDFTYDNIGVPRNTSIPGNPPADIGLGATTGDSGDNGKHKVMSLRNIAVTGPWGHNGYFRTLEQIIHFYNTRDVPEEGYAKPEVLENVNSAELGNLGMSSDEEHAIEAFLLTLTDGYED